VGRQPVEPEAIDEAAIARALSGPGGLTERRNTFEECYAMVEYASAHRQGATVAADRAAAHLSDYQHAYGQPPEPERPRGGHRRRAWEEVQRSHADALDRLPDAPDDLTVPTAAPDSGP
jgi:hypothetical protein